MIGKWQGDWQGQWQGGAADGLGFMVASGTLSFTGSGTLTARIIVTEQEQPGGGGTDWLHEYLEEQQRIAETIRNQNKAIVAMVISLAMAEDAE